METQSVDPREAFVKEITDESDVSNCTSSDYEKIEDAFLAAASEMDKYLEQCEALRAAGFVELAVSLVSLDNHRQAYDWARENLLWLRASLLINTRLVRVFIAIKHGKRRLIAPLLPNNTVVS